MSNSAATVCKSGVLVTSDISGSWALLISKESVTGFGGETGKAQGFGQDKYLVGDGVIKPDPNVT